MAASTAAVRTIVSDALILASGSASRRDLLRDAGLAFRVVVPEVDEAAIKSAEAGLDDAALALRLACAKARAVAAPEGAYVLGADQILVCDGRRHDKPPDRDAARAQLAALRGRVHVLVTAAVIVRHGVEQWHEVARPRLAMRAFSDAFLEGYLDAEGSALFASVGAYRIEGRGIQLFDEVEGEHAAIRGLPLLGVLRFLRAARIVAD